MQEIRRIGVVGSGFVSRHFVSELWHRPQYRLSGVLTRRRVDQCPEFPRPEALTKSLDELVDGSDLVFECSGDAIHAAEVIGKILDAGIPVVTLNAEFHVSVGSHYVGRGVLTEADGDQPGCLATLNEEALDIGMNVLAYVNMKAFLDRNPSRENMLFWSKKQGYSLPLVTAATDGTKVQIEQCLVANGLGANIAQEDLLGIETADVAEAATILGEAARLRGHPISDYILDRSSPHAVFVVGTHHEAQKLPLQNFKLGRGPYYTLSRPQCLVHLDAFKTIRRILEGGPVLLDNSETPCIGVASIAKQELKPGQFISRGFGSLELRGSCVRIVERPGHLPICLANNIRIKRRVEPGQVLTLDDVEVEETQAFSAWRSIERRVLGSMDQADLEPPTTARTARLNGAAGLLDRQTPPGSDRANPLYARTTLSQS